MPLPVVARRRRPVALIACISTILMPLLVASPIAHAEAPPPDPDPFDGVYVDRAPQDGRLHVVEFNACDRYRIATACNRTPAERASAIVSYINNFSSNAVMLQEICQNTYNLILGQLGGGWRGYFKHTYVETDDRCASSNPYWGIAILANGSMPSNVEAKPFYTEPISGEVRHFLCGNVTLAGEGLRLCSTHLSPEGYQWQVDYIKDETDAIVEPGAAILLGADMNVNNRAACYPEADKLRDLYTRDYGQGSNACDHNFGHLEDADNQRPYGDTFDDEITTDAGKKFDYIFFNHQRYNMSNPGGDTLQSSYSDHRYYYGAMTIY